MKNYPVMKRINPLLLIACMLGASSATKAQEYKPYPIANISEAQWQAYFDEVRGKHGATAQDFNEQKLLVYTDGASNTIYGFTKPGHPAHPAWIARKPVQRGDSISMEQIGYFAGAEPPFAKLFREYLALTEKVIEDVRRLPQPSLVSPSEAPQHSVASTNADASWRPTTQQQRLVDGITRSYFSARDANKAGEAYAFLSPPQSRLISGGTFQQLLEEFNSKVGPVKSRRLNRFTWYKDTPHGGPGLFVAVDFSSSHPNLVLHCGFIVWHEQPDGSFLQIREESNSIDNDAMAKLKPEQLESIRAQYRC